MGEDGGRKLLENAGTYTASQAGEQYLILFKF